jgi:hypothetical protein
VPVDVALISALLSALLSALAIFWTARNARKQRDHETQLRQNQEEFQSATSRAQRDHEIQLRKKQEDFESAASQAQREHETQLREKQEEFEQTLELLKGQLREVEAERVARRDYEYEARKRLYSELQPLLFELRELSESAYRWVISLARTAQQGRLSWLSKGYFLTMTLYRFTAPLAVFRLVHRRLTMVDFSVDRHIRVQYNITKQIYLSISDGFSIAKAGDHPIPYEPHEVRRRRRRKPSIHPQQHLFPIHPQQHLFRGHLDMIADAMVVRDPDGPRCMTFGEFDTEFKNPRSDVYRAIRALAAGFSEFEPGSRPVVWRMLIVQMYFHKALLHTFEPEPGTATYDRDSATFLGSPADLLSEEERQKLDWRRKDASAIQNVPREEVLEWPFNAAEEYVGERLRGFFRD